MLKSRSKGGWLKPAHLRLQILPWCRSILIRYTTRSNLVACNTSTASCGGPLILPNYACKLLFCSKSAKSRLEGVRSCPSTPANFPFCSKAERETEDCNTCCHWDLARRCCHHFLLYHQAPRPSGPQQQTNATTLPADSTKSDL